MKPDILVICGPTASGKTALAAELALRLGGEVVSADSMQVYRGMDIGTAKPTPSETLGVPHHMIDVADPEENYSVARYVQEAVPIVDGLLARSRLPIVAGGTGLYIDHLVAGRRFAPFEPDSGLRQTLQRRVQDEGLPALREELERVDPEHPPQRRKAHPAGPGGLPLHRQDHHPARPGQPGPAGPLHAADHRPRLSGAPLHVGAHRPPGGPDDGTGAGGGGPGPAGPGSSPELHRQYAKRQLTWFRRNQAAHWFHWDKVPNFSAALAFSTELVRDCGLQ